MMKTDMKKLRSALPIISVAIILFLAIAPNILHSFYVFLLTRVLFMGLVAMSLYVLMGLGGMLAAFDKTFRIKDVRRLGDKRLGQRHAIGNRFVRGPARGQVAVR